MRLALEPVVDFAIGLFSAVLALFSFLGRLWSVGGSLELEGFTIPAYMVLGAIVYGVTASALMVYVGRLLPRRVAARNAEEARLRFALTQARTAPPEEGVGPLQSPRRARIHATTDEVVRRWLAVVVQNARITWITNGSSALIPIIPLLLAAPKYFAGRVRHRPGRAARRGLRRGADRDLLARRQLPPHRRVLRLGRARRRARRGDPRAGRSRGGALAIAPGRAGRAQSLTTEMSGAAAFMPTTW